jgi:hypothetical protein
MATMPAILFDYDIQGHFRVLSSIWTSPALLELWEMLDCRANTFRSLQIERDTPDLELWNLCQARQFVLLTGNRNSKGEESLEAVIQRLSQPESLPVLTIADADRVIADRQYAEDVAVQIMEVIFNLENFRGTRRLFVP